MPSQSISQIWLTAFHLQINKSETVSSARLYYKRINFNFAITRFEHLYSNEPATSTLAHAVGFDIVLTCGKPLHDLIIKLIGITSAHVTRLTPPHFFETPEQSQDSDNSYVYRYICC